MAAHGGSPLAEKSGFAAPKSPKLPRSVSGSEPFSMPYAAGDAWWLAPKPRSVFFLVGFRSPDGPKNNFCREPMVTNFVSSSGVSMLKLRSSVVNVVRTLPKSFPPGLGSGDVLSIGVIDLGESAAGDPLTGPNGDAVFLVEYSRAGLPCPLKTTVASKDLLALARREDVLWINSVRFGGREVMFFV